MRSVLPMTLVSMSPSPQMGKAPAPEPTEQGILDIAARQSMSCEDDLEKEDRQAIKNVRKELEAAGEKEQDRKKAVDGIVNSLTLSLAQGRSLNGLTVASAYLVQEFPRDLRALNLFGSVLHTRDEYLDAIAVFEYCLTLNKNASIIKINLANCYLDADQDQKAFLILDKLRFEEEDNRSVWKSLAAYYYKKRDLGRFRECLLRSAKFKGYRQKKTKERIEKVEKEEVKPSDTLEEMKVKIIEIRNVRPLTFADLLEQDFPELAKKVADHCGELKKDERYILPTLPQANFNDPRAYAENMPIAEQWTQAALMNLTELRKLVYVAKGIDPDAPDDVIETQGFGAAMGDVADALQSAKQAMEMMKGMDFSAMGIPGMSQQQMEQATQQFGGMMDEKPRDLTALPGADSGSMFSNGNWANYKRTFDSFLAYLEKYYDEYEDKVKVIFDHYSKKALEENKAWAEEWRLLQEEHKHPDLSERHGGEVDQPCRRSEIQHKRRLNALADQYYNQWENLFFPEYPQTMKPFLEAFYHDLMLYVRNMHDPKVMQREWQNVIESFAKEAERALVAIGGGGAFSYHPEVEEEERELEAAIARAGDEARAKYPGWLNDWPPPEKGFTDWMDEHFVVEGSVSVLSVKVTTKDIEVRIAVPGVFSGAKYDFTKDKLSTYTGTGIKGEFGVNICGQGFGKLSAGVETYRRTATWDFKNGTYSETETAKAEAGYTAGPLKLSAEATLDSELHAKSKLKAGLSGKDEAEEFKGGPTLQWQDDLW